MATEKNITEFVGKKVVLTRNLAEPDKDGNSAEELTGTVEAFTNGLLMFKPKGKTTPTLIDSSDIEEIDFAPEKSKNLARKVLKIVEFGQARNHLLERHGLTLASVNGMTEQEAYEQHKNIDHEASDLGHTHGDKPKPQAEAGDSDES